MKIKNIVLISAISLCTTTAFADVVCSINSTNNQSCSAKVYVDHPNNIHYKLNNFDFQRNYSCNIVIEGDHPDQVSANFSADGITVTQSSRTNNNSVIPFTTIENTTSNPSNYVEFVIHNGRHSINKPHEYNVVYIACN